MKKTAFFALVLGIFTFSCENEPDVSPTPDPDTPTDEKISYEENSEKLASFIADPGSDISAPFNIVSATCDGGKLHIDVTYSGCGPDHFTLVATNPAKDTYVLVRDNQSDALCEMFISETLDFTHCTSTTCNVTIYNGFTGETFTIEDPFETSGCSIPVTVVREVDWNATPVFYLELEDGGMVFPINPGDFDLESYPPGTKLYIDYIPFLVMDPLPFDPVILPPLEDDWVLVMEEDAIVAVENPDPTEVTMVVPSCSFITCVSSREGTSYSESITVDLTFESRCDVCNPYGGIFHSRDFPNVYLNPRGQFDPNAGWVPNFQHGGTYQVEFRAMPGLRPNCISLCHEPTEQEQPVHVPVELVTASEIQQ